MSRDALGLPRTEGRGWFLANVTIWLALLVAALWKATAGSAFFSLTAAFALLRVASELAVLRAPVMTRYSPAAALYIGRTAANGAFICAASIIGIIEQPHAAVVVLAVCGLIAGSCLLILGVQLLARFRARE